MHRTAGLIAMVCLLLGNSAAFAGTGQATVTRGDQAFEFVVIQCLGGVNSPHSDVVVEFQLDGVPAATPDEVVARLLGVIEAGDNVAAELMPVVEYGPILSITRVENGGEILSVTDLGDLLWISDGSPMDAASRSLEIAEGRVSGTTQVGGDEVAVDASCPE